MPEIQPIPDFSSLTLPSAYDDTPIRAILRQRPNCFFVEEILGFEPAGDGEHVFLFIEKVGMNTQFVADQLARAAGVPKRLVSYSGMKDRNAVTRQWFSVHLPGNKTIDWLSLNSETLSVLTVARHRKKLRRGVHKMNAFRIKLTQVSGDTTALEKRLTLIATTGVPNYFGEQRFGHGGANLVAAYQWFNRGRRPKRHQQGIYLSAARAYIFNQVLAARVEQHTWQQAQADEWLMLDGSQSVFNAGSKDHSERLRNADIHPTGPLYGQWDGSEEHNVLPLEQETFEQCCYFTEGLEQAGLKLQRRALRVIPQQLSWQIYSDSVELLFRLPRGCFATAVVRELADYTTATDVGS